SIASLLDSGNMAASSEVEARSLWDSAFNMVSSIFPSFCVDIDFLRELPVFHRIEKHCGKIVFRGGARGELGHAMLRDGALDQLRDVHFGESDGGQSIRH